MEWLAGIESYSDQIGYVLVNTQQGWAATVADRMTDIGHHPRSEGEETPPYVGGVYWARVVSGPYDVLAGVRVQVPGPPGEVGEEGYWPQALGAVVLDIQNLEIEVEDEDEPVLVMPVTSTLTMVMLDTYPRPPGPTDSLP